MTCSAGRHIAYVVTGAAHGEFELAENMTGAEFLPQVSMLAHVDAVITHGGNNTVTESMWFGKPMIVLPIFWDQHDNAQRVHETGHGVRLPTYTFDDDELIDALLCSTDRSLRDACETAGRRSLRRLRDGRRGGADRAPRRHRRAGVRSAEV